MHSKAPFAVFLVSLLVSNTAAAQEPAPKLRIVVIAGQGTINNIHSRANTTPVIEVQDENRKPIPGVPVVFFLPTQGPGGVFSDGATTRTARTDSHGRAAASGIRFNSQTGSFDIRVTASYQGETATETVTETNAAGTSASGGGGGGGFSTRTWAILGVSVGVAVAGILLATLHRGTSKEGPAPVVITAGTPTVGAPQ